MTLENKTLEDQILDEGRKIHEKIEAFRESVSKYAGALTIHEKQNIERMAYQRSFACNPIVDCTVALVEYIAQYPTTQMRHAVMGMLQYNHGLDTHIVAVVGHAFSELKSAMCEDCTHIEWDLLAEEVWILLVMIDHAIENFEMEQLI